MPWPLSKIKEEGGGGCGGAGGSGGKGDGKKKILTRKEKNPSPTAERRKTRSKKKS